MATEISFSQLIHDVFNKKRPSIKGWVYVKAKYRRGKNGRFTGPRIRKGYSRRILDRTRLVTGHEMLAENVAANNVLLKRLKEGGNFK